MDTRGPSDIWFGFRTQYSRRQLSNPLVKLLALGFGTSGALVLPRRREKSKGQSTRCQNRKDNLRHVWSRFWWKIGTERQVPASKIAEQEFEKRLSLKLNSPKCTCTSPGDSASMASPASAWEKDHGKQNPYSQSDLDIQGRSTHQPCLFAHCPNIVSDL